MTLLPYTLYGQLLYRNGAAPLGLRWTIIALFYTQHQVSTELSGASSPMPGDPQAPPWAITRKWNPVDSTCTLSMHRDNSTCTQTMAGRMRWTPAGLVIVGTWAHPGDDATTATATIEQAPPQQAPRAAAGD